MTNRCPAQVCHETRMCQDGRWRCRYDDPATAGVNVLDHKIVLDHAIVLGSLSEEQRRGIETYLCKKWGLPDVP